MEIKMSKQNQENREDANASTVEAIVNGTEKEIQARIDFKLSELLTGLENRAKAEWNNAFNMNSQKHTNYWEAFSELKKMLRKEIEMAPPHDEMAEVRRKEVRDEAVSAIADRLIKKGEPNYHGKLKAVVDAVEKAQYW